MSDKALVKALDELGWKYTRYANSTGFQIDVLLPDIDLMRKTDNTIAPASPQTRYQFRVAFLFNETTAIAEKGAIRSIQVYQEGFGALHPHVNQTQPGYFCFGDNQINDTLVYAINRGVSIVRLKLLLIKLRFLISLYTENAYRHHINDQSYDLCRCLHRNDNVIRTCRWCRMTCTITRREGHFDDFTEVFGIIVHKSVAHLVRQCRKCGVGLTTLNTDVELCDRCSEMKCSLCYRTGKNLGELCLVNQCPHKSHE